MFHTDDITDRIIAERELKKYTEHLEEIVAKRTRALEEAQIRLVQQTRLATLGQIAGGIAHELRTPLGAIKNAAYFINMVIESPEDAIKEALDIINIEINSSARIITSLLNFTRPKEPVRHVIDVEYIIQQALSHTAIPPEIEIEQQIKDNLPAILADAGQLEQVFGNLILNAIQAMPQGGRLTFCAEMTRSLPDKIEIGFLPDFDTQDKNIGWVVVSVGDTGVGISPEHRLHLFAPFFTTKTRGMGLGLALIRLLTEANNGGITVESALGQGTTFYSYWPIVLDDELPKDEAFIDNVIIPSEVQES
jgi:two-component system sensor kinase FixL